MTTADLLNIRLYNQGLVCAGFEKPEEVVAYMGAMQSQAYEMAKWGIGVRLPGTTNALVEEAFNQGRIIRTHILRPTWHFVVAEDFHWMMELSSPRLRPVFLNYGKMRGMDEEAIMKASRLVVPILEKYGHLTRLEIGEHLKTKGVDIDRHDMSHIMSRAELDGIVCNGAVKGNKQTYALLAERVPKGNRLTKEEALEKLARKFFTSHGPATLQDYVWWSGLLTSDARKSVECIKDDFICEEINGKSYWMKNDIQEPKAETSALLLPAFDEYVVSYKDRSEILSEPHYRKIITRTGVFSPTITYNGEIIGNWKRVVKRKSITAELAFFESVNKQVERLFQQAVKLYEQFYG
ncbi:winged helix DNA-binding domain-containing protein [Parabacteroides sp. PF5-9]|uniref:winged helix DNA-binding domain-containing protein n=1 Tax=Parabacteroides sp. PF5-9 TaxID=1742404 RepID=UPI0024758F63|nr:winged helix DNA-binding domain-containing protein [Parabacteroides sp. PF5-9]MDH6356706.1 hypothetical protein [Parabacteroides sp. PF5-9]